MRALVQRFPFGAFVLIACAVTWPLAAGMRLSLLLPLLALFGPLVAALVVVGATEGRTGLKDLWRRFALRPGDLGWAAVAVAFPLLLLVPIWLLERLAGASETAPAFVLGPITALSLALALLIVGEEVGWRGFALPYLIGKWPALWSGLVVGAVWALWHLPNFFLPGYPHRELPFAAFFLMVVAYSVLFTWLHARTRGSLLVAVVFHAALNLFSLAGIDPARQSWWRALVYGAAALAVAAAPGGLRLAEAPTGPARPGSRHSS
jgi:uncharacterized protein